MALRRFIWTTARDGIVRAGLAAGTTQEEMARTLGCSRGLVQQRIRAIQRGDATVVDGTAGAPVHALWHDEDWWRDLREMHGL